MAFYICNTFVFHFSMLYCNISASLWVLVFCQVTCCMFLCWNGSFNSELPIDQFIVSPACFSGGDIQGSLLSSCVVVGVTKNFRHIFLWNHTGQLPDIWHRALVWRTVSCTAFLNLRHVHFLFYATLNIVDIGKFAHKIISVTFFSGTTEASFLIFGTEHQYGELYRVTHFWICGMSTSCFTRLWIFKRKEVGRRHMSSLENLLLSLF